MPGGGWLIITDLYTIRIVLPGDRYVVHGGHWFDGDSLLFETVVVNHAKIHLSISRDRFLKHALPVDIPAHENGVLILCDDEQDRAIVDARQGHPLGDIR